MWKFKIKALVNLKFETSTNVSAFIALLTIVYSIS